jgi:hypothetical protein
MKLLVLKHNALVLAPKYFGLTLALASGMTRYFGHSGTVCYVTMTYDPM